MTTSNSDRNCTQISPSAVLDNRLEQPELEWALEHLKECDICRDRIEEFREILVRVERLPSARAGAAALEAALHWAIPESLRSDPPAVAGEPHLEEAVPEPTHTIVEVTSQPPVAPPRTPELRAWGESRSDVSTPDWYRPVGTPAQIDEPSHPPPSGDRWRPDDAQANEPLLPFAAAEMPAEAHQTVIDSGVDSRARPKAASSEVAELRQELQATDEQAAAEVPRENNLLRVAVGVVAAACILLAGLLYGNSGLWRVINSKAINPSPSVAATARPSASPSLGPSASPLPTVAPTTAPPPTQPPAAVVATVGDGASGARLFRVRYGTADASYTRVVFDMSGQGLPTMVVTRPDDLHLVVTFKNATGAGVGVAACPCGGRIARLQPPSQQGSDLVIVVDLLRAVRPDVSTRPPDGVVAAWRLVIDLYN